MELKQIKLREAGLKDFDQLLKLRLELKSGERRFNKALLPVEKVRKLYEEYLTNDMKSSYRKIFVAVDDRMIIGMILGKRYRSLKIAGYKKRGYISNLYVKKEYRHKSVGKRLTKKVIEWFKSYGTKEATLEIYDKNKPAKELYSKLGFKDYSLKMFKKI